jgi:hypothetical protein
MAIGKQLAPRVRFRTIALTKRTVNWHGQAGFIGILSADTVLPGTGGEFRTDGNKLKFARPQCHPRFSGNRRSKLLLEKRWYAPHSELWRIRRSLPGDEQ